MLIIRSGTQHREFFSELTLIHQYSNLSRALGFDTCFWNISDHSPWKSFSTLKSSTSLHPPPCHLPLSPTKERERERERERGREREREREEEKNDDNVKVCKISKLFEAIIILRIQRWAGKQCIPIMSRINTVCKVNFFSFLALLGFKLPLWVVRNEMDGWLAILRPFQQCFTHIRMMGGWLWKAVCNGTLSMVEKISPWAGIELSLLDQ